MSELETLKQKEQEELEKIKQIVFEMYCLAKGIPVQAPISVEWEEVIQGKG